MTVTHVFFDIGGVLGTNGWDREQRLAAGRHFGLDVAELEERHGEAIAMLEQGRMGLDEYLRCAVFHRRRTFELEEFKAYMLEQSAPFPEAIELARALSRSGRYRLMTINNESAELNQHRIAQFGLREIFAAFFSSCWVGVLKPAPRIYEVALAMSQAEAGESVFIDDRERNLEPASALGMQTLRYTGALQLRQQLAGLGVQS
ncbi:MAG TPA: HAD family phosphatase [Gemmatimonadales bacterium]|nr:HAD family phosphatase [Gemmatimonadales bacterium]